MKVAILGSGPASAFAVAACHERGIIPDVYTDRPPRVDQLGAFFLHWLPPLLERYAEEAAVTVEWRAVGEAENYTRKQWAVPYTSSFPKFAREERMYNSTVLQHVWNLSPFYTVLPPLSDADLLNMGTEYDFVFHSFSSGAAGRTRKLTWFPVLSFRSEDERRATIIYNGCLQDRWVRLTRAFGRVSIEYPRDQAELAMREDEVFASMRFDKLRDIHPEVRPLSEADRLADNILPIGRFACWDRKQLSHESYAIVRDALEGQAK